MIRFRKPAQTPEISGGRRPLNAAWDPNRPLPTPSNEWVDRDVTTTDPVKQTPLRVSPGAQGGASGNNMRKLAG